NTFNRYLFVIIFNLISLIIGSKNRIFLKNNFYYNTEKNWRFFHKKQGLHSYVRGFQKRKNQLLSSYLIKNLDFKDEDIVIDIGANNGDFYLCFDKKIKYYAYEPSPIVFSNLRYNIKNQNLYNLGVSNFKNSKIDFYLSDEYGDSSILPIDNFTKKIIIKTTTLDDEIDKLKTRIKLIKIEAEGLEPEILFGLKKNLKYVDYITIDCGFERGTAKECTVAECSNYLIRNNFNMIDFGEPRIVALFKNLKK
ncbi:FkbM family methyltransferase, partial [Alphaproteobacteria bacterium]|nr:FkbM family methyltransferase [Alphaproteobacteria bacterium]